jgi:ankyrin repeat protein
MKDKTEATPLYVAVVRGHKDAAKILLEYRADPNVSANYTLESGLTPLHWAVRRRLTSTAKLLLEKGTNSNAKDNSGYTPLHYAVLRRDPQMVELLPQHGANPNIRNKYGDTPLDLTRHLDPKTSAEISNILLKHGVKTSASKTRRKKNRKPIPT